MVNNYSWNSFESNPNPAHQQKSPNNPIPTSSSQKQSPQLSWGDFQTTSSYSDEPEKSEDSSIHDITRNLISNASRAGESYVGRAGNIVQATKDILSNFPESGGLLGKAISSFVGPEKWREMIQGDPEKNSLRLPTSENIREGVESLTGDYTKPKNKIEKGFQELSSDIGSAFSRTGANRLYNNLGIPAAANAFKQFVEHLGFGEDKSQIAKMALWVPLALAGNVNARRHATNEVAAARDAIPAQTPIDLNSFLPALDRMERRFLPGDPRSTLARDQIAGIRQQVANNQTSVRDFLNRYDSINSTKNSRGLFDLGRGPDREAARRNIDDVRRLVRDQIERDASAYPEAVQQWRNGMQSLAVIHASNRYSRAADNFLKGPYGKLAASPIAGLFGLATYKNPKVAIGAAATLGGLHKTGQVAYRVWNDPRLARYYWNAMNGLARDNANVFIKNYQALDKLYKQKEQKELRVRSAHTPNKKA